jgi:hypothetical protein
LTPKSIDFLGGHHTVCYEDSSDARIFVGTIHEDQLWFAEKGCSVFRIPAHQVLQTQRTGSCCSLTTFPLEVLF